MTLHKAKLRNIKWKVWYDMPPGLPHSPLGVLREETGTFLASLAIYGDFNKRSWNICFYL
jgi:hypothetical protein